MPVTYKKLEKKFTKYGDTFTQVHREDEWAIYERKSGISGEVHHHEVIMIREEDEAEVFGKTTEPREKFPSPNQWGLYGWTTMSGFDAAMDLLGKQRSKKKAIQEEANKRLKRIRDKKPCFRVRKRRTRNK